MPQEKTGELLSKGHSVSMFATVKWTLVAGVLLTAGCGGPSISHVSGKVRVKDKPVHFGNINLMTASGEIFSGGIDEEGNYTVMNVPTGVVRVGVVSDPPSGGPPPKPVKVDPDNPNAGVAPGVPTASKWVKVDEKYADASKSGKELTLKPGNNSIDIDLD